VPLDRTADMGKHRDMIQREMLTRVDDMSRRNHVTTARELIYEKNYAVHSTAVENLLRVDSLVPTTVCVPSSLPSGHPKQ